MQLISCKRTNALLLSNMKIHYSQPKGFVGRNICYLIEHDNVYYGSIVGGSATLHLPGRNEYFGIDKSQLEKIVNNIFYHIEPNNNYPFRNFSIAVLKKFRETIIIDWKNKYGDDLIGYESLVELPRTGEIYIRDKWDLIGKTIGYTCKRIGGQEKGRFTGKRVWDYNNLRPKLVFAKKV